MIVIRVSVRAREMAQWLRTLATFPEDSRFSSQHPHGSTRLSVTRVLGFWHPHTDTHRQNSNAHKIKINEFKKGLLWCLTISNFVFVEAESHVAQAGYEQRMDLNSWSSCIHFPDAWITGVCHHILLARFLRCPLILAFIFARQKLNNWAILLACLNLSSSWGNMLASPGPAQSQLRILL